MVFAVVLSVELLAFVLTLATYVPEQDFWQSLSLRSLYLQWVGLSSAALFCALGGLLDRMTHAMAGISAWLIIIGMTILVFLAVRGLGYEMPWRILAYNLGMAAIISALLLRYLYEQHRESQRKLAESQARFQALQARIRPHFLFNSMNTIANLTRVDPALAEEVVQDLSDLFRASLSKADHRSTLGQELELAEGYLRIEKQRLGERLRIHWDLQEIPEEAPMPSLMLQPLLENAVYHGIEPSADGGDIEVVGRFRRGIVNLSIVNSLPSDTEISHREGNQIALENVRERMQQAYGESADVRIGLVEGRFQARLYFPFGDVS